MPITHAHICVREEEVQLGTSLCSKIITFINNLHCKHSSPNKIDLFQCKITFETSLTFVWVCGQLPYHYLLVSWEGCCYPVLVVPSVHVITLRQNKRSLGEMPEWYPGYHLWDPWIASFGLALVPSAGVAVALQHINVLA